MNINKAVKTKIYQLLEGTEDETVLNQVMEDVAFYANKKDVVDELNTDQLKELNKAIEVADNKETIFWDDFKKYEWRKKIIITKRFRNNTLRIYYSRSNGRAGLAGDIQISQAKQKNSRESSVSVCTVFIHRIFFFSRVSPFEVMK